jgi:hypothetical protein
VTFSFSVELWGGIMGTQYLFILWELWGHNTYLELWGHNTYLSCNVPDSAAYSFGCFILFLAEGCV